MPVPINPPPMTVTCLTRIFFAEAAAVEEEDMERTNCLVTKAMVQEGEGSDRHKTWRRSNLHTAQERAPSRRQGAGAQAPARPERRRDVIDGGAWPRGPLSPLAEAPGTAFERPSAASKPR